MCYLFRLSVKFPKGLPFYLIVILYIEPERTFFVDLITSRPFFINLIIYIKDKFFQINIILEMISLTNIQLIIMDNVLIILHLLLMVIFHLLHIMVSLDVLNHNVFNHLILNYIPIDMNFLDQQTILYYLLITFAGNII